MAAGELAEWVIEEGCVNSLTVTYYSDEAKTATQDVSGDSFRGHVGLDYGQASGEFSLTVDTADAADGVVVFTATAAQSVESNFALGTPGDGVRKIQNAGYFDLERQEGGSGDWAREVVGAITFARDIPAA